MELLKHRNTAPGGPQSQLGPKRSLPRVLKHSKIIGAKYFTKIKADQEIFNFVAFLTYGILNKIIMYCKSHLNCWKSIYLG